MYFRRVKFKAALYTRSTIETQDTAVTYICGTIKYHTKLTKVSTVKYK